ncbi:hypothetical protein I7I48_05639 [Histoplasma ohiense]|nr:hypothetical protein I7I48_05639 [Histoplasma ohiense (nom. inval.)]
MPMMGALCGMYTGSCVLPCVYPVYHSDAKSASCPASQPKQKEELLSSKERPKNGQASTAAGSITGCFFHDPARSVRFKDCTVSKL